MPTGQTITTPILSNSANLPPQTYTNCVFKAPLTDWRSQGWVFNRCTFLQSCDGVPSGTVFNDCVWQGIASEFKLQWCSGVQLNNCTFIDTNRGPIVQTRDGTTVDSLLINGLRLVRVGKQQGMCEWFLAEGPGGTFSNSIVKGVWLNGCMGCLTLDNLTVKNVQFPNVKGDSGGVYAYQTPGQGGNMTGLAFSYWSHKGGRVHLDPCALDSSWSDILWDTPTPGPAGQGWAAFFAAAGKHTITRTRVINPLPNLIQGFTVDPASPIWTTP